MPTGGICGVRAGPQPPPTGPVAQGLHPVGPRGVSCHSVATSAGRWARLPGSTWAISSGSRSAERGDPMPTRSIGCCVDWGGGAMLLRRLLDRTPAKARAPEPAPATKALSPESADEIDERSVVD